MQRAKSVGRRVEMRPSGHRTNGSMMTMVALVATIIIIAIAIGVGVLLMFLTRGRGQNAGDTLAMQMAGVLNNADRQGQMNNLVERSRELVFSSRQAYTEISGRYPHLEQLSRQLLDESRSGVRLVEASRKALQDKTVRELQDKAKRAQGRTGGSLNLSWFTSAQPLVWTMEVGRLKKMDSNVKAPVAIPELLEHDVQRNYINKANNLYVGDINAKLPSPDSDLDFKFSSLPAPVKNTIAPARLTETAMFEQRKVLWAEGKETPGVPDQIPSAVKLTLVTAVGAAQKMQGQMQMASAAASHGASKPPDDEK